LLIEADMENSWMERLLEKVAEGVVLLNGSHQITFFNHGAEQITGWKQEQVLGRAWEAVFLTSLDGVHFGTSLPVPGRQQLVVLKAAGDRLVNLALDSYQLPCAEDLGSQVALVFREHDSEATQQRQAGSFTANIAHEFRTPLSALAASIELLQEQASDLTAAQAAELLENLRLSVLSLQNLVDNLLEGASFFAGQFRISLRPSSIESIVAEATLTMKPLLDKYHQPLVVEIPAGLPRVQADLRRIVQVLVNLISNASKYGPPGGEIAIRAGLIDGQVRVEVADRGAGVAAVGSDLPGASPGMPAFSEHAAGGDFGLGLKVVSAIIAAHGGSCGVKGRLGGGSVFWFTLLTQPEA
jgi:K+-sensing histidine kinase KdpD